MPTVSEQSVIPSHKSQWTSDDGDQIISRLSVTPCNCDSFGLRQPSRSHEGGGDVMGITCDNGEKVPPLPGGASIPSAAPTRTSIAPSATAIDKPARTARPSHNARPIQPAAASICRDGDTRKTLPDTSGCLYVMPLMPSWSTVQKLPPLRHSRTVPTGRLCGIQHQVSAIEPSLK